MDAESWVKIGPTPPVDPSELTVLAVHARTPYMTEFNGADGGKPLTPTVDRAAIVAAAIVTA